MTLCLLVSVHVCVCVCVYVFVSAFICRLGNSELGLQALHYILLIVTFLSTSMSYEVLLTKNSFT